MESQRSISFKDYRAQLIKERKARQFKEPYISRNEVGPRYVVYYFRHPDNPDTWVEFRETGHLNFITHLAQKEKEFERLRADLLTWLMEGNSPFNT